MTNDKMTVAEALEAALRWIDAVPSDTVLPAMPGFDRDLADNALQDAQGAATPANRWAAAGEPDPHGKRYDCPREALMLGSMTDDELANEVYMWGDHKPSLDDLLTGKAKSSMTYLTAAKDRIRWLSRQLAKAHAPGAQDAPAPSDGLQEAATALLKFTDDTPQEAQRPDVWHLRLGALRRAVERAALSASPAQEGAPAEVWEACTCGPCPIHKDAPAAPQSAPLAALPRDYLRDSMIAAAKAQGFEPNGILQYETGETFNDGGHWNTIIFSTPTGPIRAHQPTDYRSDFEIIRVREVRKVVCSYVKEEGA